MPVQSYNNPADKKTVPPVRVQSRHYQETAHLLSPESNRCSATVSNSKFRNRRLCASNGCSPFNNASFLFINSKFLEVSLTKLWYEWSRSISVDTIGITVIATKFLIVAQRRKEHRFRGIEDIASRVFLFPFGIHTLELI